MRSRRPPAPPVSGWAGYPLGFSAATLVTIGAVATHATSHPERALIPLAVAAAAIATVTSLRAAIATAAVCWALHTGFVLGRHGDLALAAPSAVAATLIGAATLAAFALALAVRAVHRPTARFAIPAPRRAGTPVHAQSDRMAVGRRVP